MKKVLKIIVFAALITLIAGLIAFNAAAVPARPGSSIENGQCKSIAGSTFITLDDISSSPKQSTAVPEGGIKKNIPLLIIVAEFNNVDYSDEFDWSSEIFKGEKSLSSFYTDMSFGKFTFTPANETSVYGENGNTNVNDARNDGIVHITLGFDHEDWSLDYSDKATEKRMNKLLLNGIKSIMELSSDYVDYASYDSNGDGEISRDEFAIGIIFAGYEYSSIMAEPVHSLNKYIWAHAWSFTDANDEYGFDFEKPIADNVKIDYYIAMAEAFEEGDQAPISVLAHELGHYLGLPDLYDTTYSTILPWSSFTVDMLSVMCAGSWGMDAEGNYCPFSMDPWCRYKLGWFSPTVADKAGTYKIDCQNYATNSNSDYAILIPTARETEYYLLENRQANKWDEGIPMSYPLATPPTGILLWHIDDEVYNDYDPVNAVNNADHRPAVMPLYPEYKQNKVTFIGKNSSVGTDEPFFDSYVWNEYYSELGDTLYLPLYGTGLNANLPAGRNYGTTGVQFLNESSDSMSVKVVYPENSAPSAPSDLCRYCGKEHTGFFGGIVKVIHRILYFFKNLF